VFILIAAHASGNRSVITAVGIRISRVRQSNAFPVALGSAAGWGERLLPEGEQELEKNAAGIL